MLCYNSKETTLEYIIKVSHILTFASKPGTLHLNFTIIFTANTSHLHNIISQPQISQQSSSDASRIRCLKPAGCQEGCMKGLKKLLCRQPPFSLQRAEI